jgi:hypothetical protein
LAPRNATKQLTLRIPDDKERLGYLELAILDATSENKLHRGLSSNTHAAFPQRMSLGGRDNRFEPFPRLFLGRTHLHGAEDANSPG